MMDKKKSQKNARFIITLSIKLKSTTKKAIYLYQMG